MAFINYLYTNVIYVCRLLSDLLSGLLSGLLSALLSGLRLCKQDWWKMY